jgi:hypothetical protein
MEQLSFDSNDYTDMIKEQREMILNYEEKQMILERRKSVIKKRVNATQE